jgi:hypothetical protein
MMKKPFMMELDGERSAGRPVFSESSKNRANQNPFGAGRSIGF